MIEAERLNREAALLSNTLDDFADDDVDGRKPVVEKILKIREQWGWVRYEIKKGERHPDSIKKEEKPQTIENGQSELELKDELRRVRVNHSKYKSKIESNPEHKKIEAWKIEYERLDAIKTALEAEIIRLDHA